jgi:single-strand DNA-binding protein
MNSVHLIGRLAATPQLVERGDTTVATIRVAVQRPKRNGSDRSADFFDVTTFGAQARNVARYLDTGRLVGISGRLRQQTWEQDGQRRQKVDIVAAAYGIQFLDAPRGDDWDEIPEPADVDDDDIAF